MSITAGFADLARGCKRKRRSGLLRLFSALLWTERDAAICGASRGAFARGVWFDRLMGWDGYAREKVGLAFDKLVGSPNANWAEPPLVGAQSDLSAVDEEDVPEEARADLDVVKNATDLDIEVVRAISRLRVLSLQEQPADA